MNLPIFKHTTLCALTFLAVMGVGLAFAPKTYAADTVGLAYFIDADSDGTVDHAEFIFDENIDQCNFEAGDWSVDTAGTVGITAITGIDTSGVEGAGMGTCDGSDGRVYLSVTATANITGGAVAPVISYTNQGTAGSLSGVTTAQISDQTSALTDWVAPVMVSTNPSDGSTNHDKYRDIVITFSEPMNTTFLEGTQFAISPDPGSFTAVWSSADTVLTLNGPNFVCNTSYAVTTDADEMAASTGAVVNYFNTLGPESGDWSFQTNGCSGTVVLAPAPDPLVTLISPGEGDVLIAGSTQEISWSTIAGLNVVSLWYSEDGGASYVSIAQNIVDDGSYTWKVPPGITGQAVVKIDMTDLAIVLASDVSEVFSIAENTSPVSDGQSADVSLPEIIEVEAVAGVQPNTYIVGTSFNAVYYVDDEFIRHPFMNEQIYFTWQTDFSAVQQVPDATLALLRIGAPILPKPGTHLVKIQSDNSVYVVESNPEDEFSPLLRKIDSETTAKALFGSDWAQRVMDVPVTLFGRYSLGDEIVASS